MAAELAKQPQGKKKTSSTSSGAYVTLCLTLSHIQTLSDAFTAEVPIVIPFPNRHLLTPLQKKSQYLGLFHLQMLSDASAAEVPIFSPFQHTT